MKIRIEFKEPESVTKICRRQTNRILYAKAKIIAQVVEEADVSLFPWILAAYVHAKRPVEFEHRRIDGNRRLDLRCAVAAFEVSNPRGV